MRIESENKPVLGILYARYEGVRRWEQLFDKTIGGSLFIGGAILIINAATDRLPVDYAIPAAILSSLLIIPTFRLSRLTSSVIFEVARLEGVGVENRLIFGQEKRLMDKAVRMSQPISPPQLSTMSKLLKQSHTEYQLRQQMTEEQKHQFDSFDALAEKDLGYSPARMRKTAGALELARFRWQQVLQNPLYPTHYQNFAEDMLSQIGARRAKLPSTFRIET